jgi:hypothetical protein
MAFRYQAIDGERFDENLPLYGWQEDVDFAAALPAMALYAAPTPSWACIWAARAGA